MPQALTKGDLATITELRAKFNAQSTMIFRDIVTCILASFRGFLMLCTWLFTHRTRKHFGHGCVTQFGPVLIIR